MSVFEITAVARNTKDERQVSQPTEVLVDTRELTWMPTDLLTGINVTPMRKRDFTTAAKQMVTRETGDAILSAEGFETVDEVVFAEPMICAVRTIEGFGVLAGRDEPDSWSEVLDWLLIHADHELDWANGCIAVMSGRHRRVSKCGPTIANFERRGGVRTEPGSRWRHRHGRSTSLGGIPVWSGFLRIRRVDDQIECASVTKTNRRKVTHVAGGQATDAESLGECDGRSIDTPEIEV